MFNYFMLAETEEASQVILHVNISAIIGQLPPVQLAPGQLPPGKLDYQLEIYKAFIQWTVIYT